MRGWVVALALAAVTGGCVRGGGTIEGGDATLDIQGVVLPSAEGVVEAFRPRSVRVHPLSRVERVGGGGAGDGALRLVVHVELLDAQGQSVKWPGVLGVAVRAGVAEGSGPVWQNLTTPEGNALAWDVVTRTYVIRRDIAGSGLGPRSSADGVPIELSWVQGRGGGGGGGGGVRSTGADGGGGGGERLEASAVVMMPR